MKTRIIVGLFLAALLIATLYLGGYFYLTTIALVSFAATYEVAHVITKKGFRPLVFPAYIFALAFPFVYHFGGLVILVMFYLFSIILSMVRIHSGWNVAIVRLSAGVAPLRAVGLYAV